MITMPTEAPPAPVNTLLRELSASLRKRDLQDLCDTLELLQRRACDHRERETYAVRCAELCQLSPGLRLYHGALIRELEDRQPDVVRHIAATSHRRGGGLLHTYVSQLVGDIYDFNHDFEDGPFGIGDTDR
ncbi:hypothetical protein [Saccharothrix hoggarensis]|uniref:Uncharacterized protein n=1 Tax=Saccharothrix hoggarensis TaxID=913853 RepID=A0ABW3QNG7_9PSEU